MSSLALDEGCGNSDDNGTIGRTQELCDLFTSTVSSLAVDAATLKQLTSLRLAVDMDEDLDVQQNVGRNNENVIPNNNDDHKNKVVSMEMMEQLCQIDSSVSELEHKMNVLREIVAEENRSLQELEAVKQAAESQTQLLNQMLETSKDLRLPGDSVSVVHKSNEEGRGTTRTSVLDTTATTRPFSNNSSSTASRSRQSSSYQKVTKQKQGIHQKQQQENINIPLVTESEFNNVSRNIRGRITLAVLNDAVLDIEHVCRNKYAILYSRHKKKSASAAARGGPRGLQMEKQYQQQLNTHRDLQVQEHGNAHWVAEQDLRQACAFFRSGESTARAILILLRTLKRLKQVPGKNSQVTYVVLRPQAT